MCQCKIKLLLRHLISYNFSHLYSGKCTCVIQRYLESERLVCRGMAERSQQPSFRSVTDPEMSWQKWGKEKKEFICW